MFPKLELYYFDACPFCQIVLREVKALNLKVTYNHIYKEPQHHEKLYKDTGRGTTPCLYIDGKPMFESADIIEWLNDNKEKLEKES
jgi:glutaredoxin